MPYTPETWEDFPSTDTPVTAARLNNIETGVDLAVGLGEGAVQASTVNAKGDLLVATANDTVTRQAVGANNTVLMANSAQTSGMEWTSDVPVAALAPGSAGQILTTTGGVPTWGSAAEGETTGVIKAYAGSTAPTGYLLCDGSAVSRTGQSALFAVCGTSYGAGDGSTTFNIPDIRGRMPVGKGTNASVDTLGESEGLAEASRRPHHPHTVTDPGHLHFITSIARAISNAANTAWNVTSTGASIGTNSNSAVTGISVGVSGATDTPSFVVVNYIIKT